MSSWKEATVATGGAMASGLLEKTGASPRPADAAPGLALSLRLRNETAELHQEIEGRVGFPASIKSLAVYRSSLVSYFRLYSPVEFSLAAFPEWAAIGIQIEDRSQSPRLAKDLRALGVDPSRCLPASAEWMPQLPGFAHALGVFYVLEGSTLGGRFILHHLRETLGDCIEGADAFFDGHGPGSGAMWSAARQAIDAYGEMCPEGCKDAVEGAQSAFRCIGNWLLRAK